VDIGLGRIHLREEAKQECLDVSLALADKTGIAEEFAKEMVDGFPLAEFRPRSSRDQHASHKVRFSSISDQHHIIPLLKDPEGGLGGRFPFFCCRLAEFQLTTC
jgi:hypothetical protein